MNNATVVSKPPKVALVYDRVNTTYGGAEQVLLALHTAFPTAPLFTSLADKRAQRWAHVFTIKTSWLQHLPFASYFHRLLAAFMPLAFESLRLADFDIVISVASAECKGVLTTPDQLHVCYLLSPPRYLYHQRQEMLAAASWHKIPGLRQLGELALNYLNWWDQAAMSRPDKVYPLSQTVADRYWQIYGRQPDEVIYPPIDSVPTKSEKNSLPPELKTFVTNHPNFALVVARLVPYKRVDLAIQACRSIDQPLIVIGTGPEENAINQLQNPGLLLCSSVDSETLHWLYDHSQMVLIPGLEDFGLTALEANAHGKPAIVNAHAGAAEVIIDNKHGFHLSDQSISALAKLIKKCRNTHFSAQALRQNALKYDTSKFVSRFKTHILRDWHQLQSN